METKIELERRWLLKRCPDWVQESCLTDVMIYQFYTADGWRYRKIESLSTYKSKYERTKKVSVDRGINHEIGTEKITKKDFLKAEHDATKRIVKNRMTVEHEGRLLEFDCFNELDLVIVEVEGVTMYDTVVFPEVVEKDVLMEVTGNPVFANINLADDVVEDDDDNEDSDWMNDDDDDDND